MVKYQESYHLLLQFESTPVKFWKKQVCAKAQMDQFGGSCSQVSAVWACTVMNIIYEWCSTLSNFPEAPHGN